MLYGNRMCPHQVTLVRLPNRRETAATDTQRYGFLHQNMPGGTDT